MRQSSLSILAVLSSTTSALECTRQLLQETVDNYISVQGSGKTSDFNNLSDGITYLENNKTSSITVGLPSSPLVIDTHRSVLDTTACRTFTEFIVTDPKHPYVVHTQMSLDKDGKVTLFDSIVTDKGDWAFNATGYKYWNGIETWDPIPEAKRLSRADLKAAADTYPDRCNDTSVIVPFNTPCARLEGGAYTGRGNLSANTCDIGGLPSRVPMINRRYVIDEVYGVVDIFLGFTGLDRTRPAEGAPDSHLFRIEEGKIRYIHTVSACFVDGCGMNGTGPPGGVGKV